MRKNKQNNLIVNNKNEEKMKMIVSPTFTLFIFLIPKSDRNFKLILKIKRYEIIFSHIFHILMNQILNLIRFNTYLFKKYQYLKLLTFDVCLIY